MVNEASNQFWEQQREVLLALPFEAGRFIQEIGST
jgi:hypothetical protein